MSSKRKILANRQNSKKSTGPRSVAGKAASSLNHTTRSGIFAESEIIRGESAADLDALVADYRIYFQPDGPAESALVDILVHSEWTLRRLRRAEAQLWERNIDATEGSVSGNRHELGRAVDCDESRVFGRLQRRLDSVQRNYQKALEDLQQLQQDRRALEPVGFELATTDAVPQTSSQRLLICQSPNAPEPVTLAPPAVPNLTPVLSPPPQVR